ncbi:MAG: hypothetical protein O6944_08435 [Gammaproteobacteria bacterium]|nr:hypothetical protein [Gammaproteobacteria bacterium]
MTPLEQESILFIFAQVAVLFAGFGGVSVIIGRIQTDLERARLRNVVITAILLLLMSLFPLLPNQLGAEPDVTWRIETGVFAFITIIFYAASGDLRLFKEADRLDQAGMIGDFVLWSFLLRTPWDTFSDPQRRCISSHCFGIYFRHA